MALRPSDFYDPYCMVTIKQRLLVNVISEVFYNIYVSLIKQSVILCQNLDSYMFVRYPSCMFLFVPFIGNPKCKKRFRIRPTIFSDEPYSRE